MFDCSRALFLSLIVFAVIKGPLTNTSLGMGSGESRASGETGDCSLDSWSFSISVYSFSFILYSALEMVESVISKLKDYLTQI